MSIQLLTVPDQLRATRANLANKPRHELISVRASVLEAVLRDAEQAHELHALINNPHTAEFLEATRMEAAHQRDRWGEAHDRGKSAENWFWLVGYLAGKCLRAVISGEKEKALHHTISSAAALANWFEAIKKDETGTGAGQDNDIKPVEIARFEGAGASGGTLVADNYSGR